MDGGGRLLLLLGWLNVCAAVSPAPAPRPITVTPSVVPQELATRITISTNVSSPFGPPGTRVTVRIKSIDNAFVDAAYSSTGYNCMVRDGEGCARMGRAALVVCSVRTLRCRSQANMTASVGADGLSIVLTTVPTQNSAPALVAVQVAGETGWSANTSLRVVPLLEVAVGRRPYTSERRGALVLTAAGQPLLPPGGARLQVHASLPSSVAGPEPLVEGAEIEARGCDSVSSEGQGSTASPCPGAEEDVSATSRMPGLLDLMWWFGAGVLPASHLPRQVRSCRSVSAFMREH